MIVVSNSSPLIYLSKIQQLILLRKLFGKVIIPVEVYEEVVIRGRAQGYSDTNLIEEGVEQGWIEIVKVNTIIKILEKFDDLDEGEKSAITLAVEKKAGLVLIDDAVGRHVAKILKLPVRGTLYVLMLALERNILTVEEAKYELEHLIRARFRLAPELYARAVRTIDEYSKV